MKNLKMSIIIVTLAVLSGAQTECKTKVIAQKKATEKGLYEDLKEKYAQLERNFEKLEAQRAIYEAKNPSRDEMAKLDNQIAILREKADRIYSQMSEMPQFSTFEGKTIPASPQYMQECAVRREEIKKTDKEIKKLTKDVSNKK